MMLSIVIPAYNEEQAIGAIIERTLAARDAIRRDSPIDAVEVIVVNDGSRDRTMELASGYDGIELISFERNRGYGAAIKAGFERTAGDIVGFLDADGTCDPRFFAILCGALIEEGADVAIGSRMGPDSRMPRVRRLGNRIYACILSALSNRVVTDTASGMRVIRRDALARLYPLPDGLHFTPAMSARVLMDDRLAIVERPMSYKERVGESKLNVVRDGLRFLGTILAMSLHWRPGRLFVAGAAMCAALMTLFAAHPVEMWLRQRRLEEDMIYRLLFCSLMGTFTATLLSAATVCDHLRRLLDHRTAPRTFAWRLLDSLYSWSGFAVAATISAPIFGWLVGPGVWTWLTAGFVEVHWSRIVLGGLIAAALGQLGVTLTLVNILRFHAARGTLRATEAVLHAASSPTRSLLGSPAKVPHYAPSNFRPQHPGSQVRASLGSATPTG